MDSNQNSLNGQNQTSQSQNSQDQTGQSQNSQDQTSQNQYGQDQPEQNPYYQEQAVQNHYGQEQNGQSQYNQNPYGQSTYQSSQYQTDPQQTVYQPVYQPELEEPVSLLDWIGTILLSMVPCVGLIIYIVWAFSSDTKKSKANYCKANLIIMLVVGGLSLIIFIAVMAGVLSYL